MSIDSEAAALALRYGKVINLATKHAHLKYRSYLAAAGDSAPFGYQDIRQTALEAVLMLAGLLPGSKLALAGTLAQIETQGGERYVQRTVDMYVSSRLSKEMQAHRAKKRAGPELASGYAVEECTDSIETNPEALTGLAARFPALWLTRIQGNTAAVAAGLLGLSDFRYRLQVKQETVEFSAWAYANHRVAALGGCRLQPYC